MREDARVPKAREQRDTGTFLQAIKATLNKSRDGARLSSGWDARPKPAARQPQR